MLFKSLLLTAAVAVSSVFAAADTTSLKASVTSTTSVSVASGCSFSKTLTITAQSDLDSISTCNAIKGDILVQGDALATVNIASVKAIYGDLTIFNATAITSVAASDLTTITGTFALKDLTILSEVDIQGLSSVGAINFVTLPALETINFGTGITDCESIYISDTELQSLDGISVTNVEVFNVNNNKNLNTINSQLQTVSSALEISYNSNDLEATFDDLIWANNITLRDVASVTFPNLTSVNASFGVITTDIESITADYLTKVGGTFIINDNDNLSELKFPELSSVGGGFVITNNSELHNITGFGSLKTIGGAVVITGDIDEASFSSLKSVKGGFSIESEGDLNCKEFKKLDKKGVIQGDKFVCKGASTSVSSSSSKHTSSSASSSASASASASSSASSSASASSTKSSSGGAAVQGLSIFGTLAAIALSLF